MNKLYVVSTPIGNIDDISKRAIDTLTNVNCIFAEDTKHTSLFLSRIGVKNKLISLHKFNEASRVSEVIEFLRKGDVAIVSDAGTPTISDPGQLLISKLIRMDITVNVIPGPTAITSALSVSGLVFENFTFIGFMPRKENQINEIFKKHINSEVIGAYESPNRINKTITFLETINPNMKITIARELTKIFEEVISGTPEEIKNRKFRGEIVILISEFKQKQKDQLDNKVELLINEGMTSKSIVNYLMKTESIKKNDIYERIKNYE